MSSSPSNAVSTTVKIIDSALKDALKVPQDAQHQVQLQEPACWCSSSPSSAHDHLNERLQAFESFIIQRVREECARASAGVLGLLDARPTGAPADTPAPTVTSSQAFGGLMNGRRLDVQLEAQRTRSVAMEQLLTPLEAKFNALMTDMVAQAQAENSHRKQLLAAVDATLKARMSTESEAGISRFTVDGADLSLMETVTRALAAMHERVGEQHTELTRWQQQNYERMRMIVTQSNCLKEDNRQLHGGSDGFARAANFRLCPCMMKNETRPLLQ
ncbi:hypothetical protein CUR178_01253 [Leishmania enriettii]|uniref:Uncharacterized protein n=1 Tax=Leishmania enriettii TaxID=5663 RepID=A0A836H0C6_LEIEN|nr:hypothetical protein CUR178_01253 [Leishmania enriettii]